MTEPATTDDERAIRTALIAGVTLALLGIGAAAVAPTWTAGSLLVIGFGAAVWGTHRYGRLGPDAPVDLGDDLSDAP
jgi:hypothetical protein